jgi:GxxExxY protein
MEKTNSIKPENRLSGLIVDVCYKIHTELGPGLLESVYEEILSHVQKRGLKIAWQKAIPVTWDNLKMELGFRADLIAENKVLIELKAPLRLRESSPLLF